MDAFTAFGIGVIAATTVSWLLVKQFLPAYVAEKGKNLATKEDIAAITHEVERVRTQYAVSIEALRETHSLRMAALDRRLQAHQEAFTHWRKLINAVHTPGVTDAVIECQAWWEKNCLYLEPSIRTSFVDAFQATSSHASLLQDRGNPDLVKENWMRIVSFPNKLFAAIQLPELSQSEAKALSVGLEKGAVGG